MVRHYYFISILLLVSSCTNVEDADPTDRVSFVRYYGTGLDHTGVMAIPDNNGGYIVVGNVTRGETSDITVIKTDDRGNTLWETIVPDGSANSVVLAPDGGYFITGDRIAVDNRAGIPLSEVVNTQAHIFKVSSAGVYTTGNELILRDTTDNDAQEEIIDFKGHASVVVDDSLFVLGSYKFPQLSLNNETYEQAFIAAYALADVNIATEPAWAQVYNSENRDFKNSNTLHFQSQQNFVWANTYILDEDGIAQKDANIYVVPKNSVNTDNDQIRVSNRAYTVADFQPSIGGYGLVGTYSQLDGTGSNIFFARYQPSGDKGSITEVAYFDGVSLALSEADRDLSISQDEAKAITGTSDGGFVLACAFTSTLTAGNGGKDIQLIKVDPFGKLLWSQLIGGSGDEIAASIRENEDGSLVISGTIIVNGLSSLMLIKTDNNGQLTN